MMIEPKPFDYMKCIPTADVIGTMKKRREFSRKHSMTVPYAMDLFRYGASNS